MKHSTTSELTKMHIGNALLVLMQEKPINKITVKELAEYCQINRQTFYYHFSDIYELLEWLLKKKLHSIALTIESCKTWQDASISLLNYLKENSALVLSTFNSVSRSTLLSLIYDEINRIANKFVYEIAGGIKASEASYNNVIHFCCVTFTALLEDWLMSKEDMNRSSKELIDNLDIIVSGLVRNALTRYAIKEGVL